MSQLVRQVLEEYDPEKILPVMYHFHDTDNPLYQANSRDHDIRQKYYNVWQTPWYGVDGKRVAYFIATNPTGMRKVLDAALNVPSPLSIVAHVRVDTLEWRMTAEVTAEDEVPDVDLVLQFMVIQNEAHFDKSPGFNGQKDFYHEMRWMLPNGRGETFRIAKGKSKEFVQSIPAGDIRMVPAQKGEESIGAVLDSQKGNFHVVVFVEEHRSKTVLQTTKALMIWPEPPKSTAVPSSFWGMIKAMFY